ncbi:hypothetical protein Btru_059619 [Bulinus truncatus]|nr:hypothetical protein Btru_059619 [Bulinus truncatus]
MLMKEVAMDELFICLFVLFAEYRASPTPVLTLNVILPFALPALCYTINNNLAVFMQTQMDPATYVVLGNLKIVTTAMLYKIIIRNTVALEGKSLALSEIHITFLGLATLLCYCFISGFAGVFTEYILKKHLELSVFYQNILLYLFGVLFNFVCWIIQAHQKTVATNQNYFNIFEGYSVFTWTVIISQAVTGIIFSLIMKYNNNIVRLFIIATAPLVTTALSYYFFELQINGDFIVSALFILIAAVSYNYNQNEDINS